MKRFTQVRIVLALFAGCLCGAGTHAQTVGAGIPVVAYSYKGVLYLTNQSGTILKTIKTRLPIGKFAISPDNRLMIFSEPNPREVTGGPLWILNTSNGALERMAPDPYFNSTPGKNLIEFYSDPEFSPDGKNVVFATHARATGDLVQTKGPLAILDIDKRQIRSLNDTLAQDGTPIGFPSEPHWSPDGKRILFNFEGSAWTTDSNGTKLIGLVIPESEYSESALKYGMAAIDWIGSKCVLYIAGDDPAARVNEFETSGHGI